MQSSRRFAMPNFIRSWFSPSSRTLQVFSPCLNFGLEFPQHFGTGNILKDPKKPADLLKRDLFSKEDCTKASLVMRRLADPVAPMYIWTPEYRGDSKGNNEHKVDVARNWMEVLSGKCLSSMSYYETPCNNVSRKS